MANQTYSNTTDILKEKWVSEMIETQFNDAQILRDKFGAMAGTKPVDGRYYLYPLNTTRNFGGGSRSETGTLPTAGRQGYDSATLYRAHQYQIVGITGAAIDAGDGAVGGSLLQRELGGCIRDAKKECQRIMWGDGSGLLAKVATVTSTTVFTVNVTSQQLGMKYMQPGRVVDVLVMTTGATSNGVVGATISSINKSTATVTLGTACAGAIDTTYGVYVSGARNLEAYGIRAIVDNVNPGMNTVFGQGAVSSANVSGYYGGIDRTAAGNEYWQANVFGNSGSTRPFAHDLAMQAFTAGEEVSGMPCDFAIASYGVWRAAGNSFFGGRRWEDNVKLEGGYKYITWNGINIYADVDAPPNSLYFLCSDSFDILEETPLGWARHDGLTLLREATTDSYVGRLVTRWQLGCNQPNANTVLTDIAEE